MQQMGRNARGPAVDAPMPDTAEKIQISSLSLLKMLKHGELGDDSSTTLPLISLTIFFDRSRWSADGSNGTHAGPVR